MSEAISDAYRNSKFKRVVGYGQDYPGSCRWPIHEILCPECGKWCGDYGEVDVLVDGEWRHACIACGDKVVV